MATVKAYLSSRVNQAGKSEIYLRVSLSKHVSHRLSSGLAVNPARFRDGKIIIPRAATPEAAELRKTERLLTALCCQIVDRATGRDGATITKGELTELVARFHRPADAKPDFYALWVEFMDSHDLNDSRRRHFLMLGRALYRFEVYRRATVPGFSLDVDRLTADDIAEFDRFFRSEWKLYDAYPDTDYPRGLELTRTSSRPHARGNNVTVKCVSEVRSFFNWLHRRGITSNRPFDGYAGKLTERYGRPWYLTIEERDRLAEHDFSERPQLGQIRDIFVFQCLIGCRVSDLSKLTRDNVIGDFIEYMPQKTAHDRADIVRVPLNARARDILARYADSPDRRLLPFVSDQYYNRGIKEACRLAGLDRRVTVINSTTGTPETHPLYEIASSHLARRTFIGNIYKHVKDPNLVGALSGHKEGSRAFARYRDIDDDMRRELVDLIK